MKLMLFLDIRQKTHEQNTKRLEKISKKKKKRKISKIRAQRVEKVLPELGWPQIPVLLLRWCLHGSWSYERIYAELGMKSSVAKGKARANV